MAKFLEMSPNRGVDNLPSGQDWMMVPTGKDNYVRLVDGAGFSVQPLDPKHHLKIAEVNGSARVTLLKKSTSTFEKDRIFRVSGLSAGPSRLIAKNGKDETKIEVSVKNSKSYSIAYYFIQDAGAKGTRSTFSATDTDGWIKGLNDVFGLQANLWFT